MSIHSSGQTISGLPHLEGITLGTGEEVYEIAGRASTLGLGGIGQIGDRLVKVRLLVCMEEVFIGLWHG